MSVLLEAYSVIVRKSTLEAKYPGGAEGYWRDCPNNTFCADGHLARIGFMASGDADDFVASLAAKGLTPFRKDAAEDVMFVDSSTGPTRPCAWLEFGRWGPADLAWLAGTARGDFHAPANWSPDRGLRRVSMAELKDRLEFVRTENNVDVYRDKVTGQELYTGRTSSATDDARARHDTLYRKATELIDGLLMIGNQGTGPLASDDRKRLDEAIRLFTEVVQINPGNWAAMWFVGKVHQRLADNEQGLSWFARAHRVNPDQPDVAREAAIAAMEVGRPADAIPYCVRAIEANPEDAGLQANLALALLFAQRPKEAYSVAQESLARDPSDQITAHIASIIDEVLAGHRPCPKHVRDLQ